MKAQCTTKDLSQEIAAEDMECEPDERVFALMNRAQPRVIDALGVIEEGKPSALVGVYFSWNSKGRASEFIHEMGNCYGQASFTTLGKEMPPGFVCKMQIAEPMLREVPENDLHFKKVKLGLLEIRASNPKPTLILYYDTARMLWLYKPLIAELAGLEV